MAVTVWMIPFCISFLIQNLILFSFIGKIVDPKSASHRNSNIVAVINCALFSFAFLCFSDNAPVVYLLLAVVYAVETCLLFKADTIVKISCGLALPVHVMALRNIITSTYQLIQGIDNIDVAINPAIYWNTLLVTSVLCTLAMFLLFIIIPDAFFKMMNQSGDRMVLFLAFMATACVRLMLTGAVYNLDSHSTQMAIQQIASAISWMFVVYTGVFMLIGFEMLNEKKEKLQNRLAREQIYRNAMLSNSDTTIEIDCEEDKIVYVNVNGCAKESLTGVSYTEYISGNIQTTFHKDDKNEARNNLSLDNIERCIEKGDSEFDFDARIRKDENRFEWYNVNVNIELDVETNRYIAIVTFINNHLEKIAELELKYKSERDPLVGAYNKSTVEAMINEHITSGRVGVMMMIDLDNFKAINDTYGHSYGDRVLCEVNDKLNEIFRENDIIGRIGGDEFLVYVKNVNESNIIIRRADAICKSLHKTYHMEDKQSVTVSSSVGVALNPNDADSFESLFDKADIAMYNAKKGGKNTFKIYNNNMQKEKP